MPSDPKELILAAARLNSLTGSDMLPWHIKASFQILDENGSATDEGTYEEFWASPKSSKRIFTGNAFTQTEYTTDKGDFRASSHGDMPALLYSAHNDLVSPMPSEPTIEHSNFSSKTIENGSLKLTCLTPAGTLGASTFCLASGEPFLRLYALPASSTQVLYNRILRFGGRAVAGDLKLTRSGKVVVSLHVDTLESLDTKNEAAFTPPPEAALVPIPHLVNISAAVAQGMAEYKVAPTYPPEAKASHISGTVVLQGTIGKDGHIKDLKVVGGPPALQTAAVDAVRFWRYKPYLLNGQPVEVMTTINVIFQLAQ